MVTIAELEQRVSDNRRAGARLLSTEETLAVLALLKCLAEWRAAYSKSLGDDGVYVDKVMRAFDAVEALP